jgi:rsbT co-antagonist protein RsbR
MTPRKQETLIATPIAILWERILMLPIVGGVDAGRAQKIMETVLARVHETDAKVIVLDILGVPTVDSKVAALLVKIAQACKLMGAKTIVSGMSPRIAQTLVGLGIEMEDVMTEAPLKDAVRLAFDLTGWEVVAKKKPATK